MAKFLTRKKDGQVFPTDRKIPHDSGNPSYVGVDKSQIKNSDKLNAEQIKIKNKLVDAGFDLNNKVNFWGQKITLNQAIKKFDKDDIKDAEKLIRQKEAGLPEITIDKYGNKLSDKKLNSDLNDIKQHSKEIRERSKEINRLNKEVVKELDKNKPDRIKVRALTIEAQKVIDEQIRAIKKKDSDGDGVPDSEDCEPNNPKKQGKIHDIAKRILVGKSPKSAKEERKELEALQKEGKRLEELANIQKMKDVEEAKIQESKDIIRSGRQRKFGKSVVGRIVKVATSEKTKKIAKKLLSEKKPRKVRKKKKKSKEGLAGIFS